jgi:hypothetical protein
LLGWSGRELFCPTRLRIELVEQAALKAAQRDS